MGPDRKRGIVVDDDMRAALTTGDYVKVELDSSPGMNRPDGYGFILETHGVGPASTFTVKYGPVYGSLTFKRIPVSAITPAAHDQPTTQVPDDPTNSSSHSISTEEEEEASNTNKETVSRRRAR